MVWIFVICLKLERFDSRTTNYKIHKGISEKWATVRCRIFFDKHHHTLVLRCVLFIFFLILWQPHADWDTYNFCVRSLLSTFCWQIYLIQLNFYSLIGIKLSNFHTVFFNIFLSVSIVNKFEFKIVFLANGRAQIR